MKAIDRQTQRSNAARSYHTNDLGDNLRRFVEQGIVNDHQRNALKKAGYIEYTHRSWSLNEAGKVAVALLDYVPFGDVARDQCGMQCQYCSRYVHGTGDYPNLGEGLRFTGTSADYHAMKIHKDDVAVFVSRVQEHRGAMGC